MKESEHFSGRSKVMSRVNIISCPLWNVFLWDDVMKILMNSTWWIQPSTDWKMQSIWVLVSCFLQPSHKNNDTTRGCSLSAASFTHAFAPIIIMKKYTTSEYCRRHFDVRMYSKCVRNFADKICSFELNSYRFASSLCAPSVCAMCSCAATLLLAFIHTM